MRFTPLLLAPALLFACSNSDSSSGDGALADAGGGGPGSDAAAARPYVDPGTADWVPVPAGEVEETCKLDPAMLDAVDTVVRERGGLGWALVRYGRLCHEYSPSGDDPPSEAFSATKTLGALVTGAAAYQTRELPRTGPKTGPLSDMDRVDHWLDSFTFNRDAQVAHVLGMVGHGASLAPGQREFAYDTIGDVQINRLSDVVNTAIAQDPGRLGANLEEFTQRHVYQPLGMRSSTWSGVAPTKVYAFSWVTTLGDMARVGLLLLNHGMWNGERILSEEWAYRMTHPSFEDANTAYGYLTWLAARTNWINIFGPKLTAPGGPCLPAPLWNEYPHEPSGLPDCGYGPGVSCEQERDVGVWFAAGMNGQYIIGHPGLDMVVVVKRLHDGVLDPIEPLAAFTDPVLRAVAARDPVHAGDFDGFCAAYGANRHAPDLR
ncbi:MAG: hypothetical protein FJ104_06865 [Deltaproteobacteria bacterium]|nr:hypothetical protein [Deltaproteobacteria bacterium]